MFFWTHFWPQKRSPGQNVDPRSTNLILGSKICPQARTNKRCALKNHAEPKPRNSKRSHIVQVMAKNHFGGYLSKSGYVLGGKSCSQTRKSCFQEGNSCVQEGESCFQEGESLIQEGKSCFQKGEFLFSTMGNPVFEKGNPVFKKGLVSYLVPFWAAYLVACLATK